MTAAQARGWWRPTTTVIGIMVLAMGLLGLAFGEATDGGAGGAVAAASALVSGGLLLGGLVRQRRHHAGGSRLVFGGAVVLALGDPLLIPLSLLVIIGGQWSGSLAISARADQRPVRLEASRASLTAGWYRWLVAAIALAAVGFATLAIWPAITPDRCTEGNVCWEDTAAWATWILSWLAAAVTGTIGAALLLLRLVDRHHTRTA